VDPAPRPCREAVDDLAAERLEVVRLAAADEDVRAVLADHDLLVLPVGTGVAQVGLHAGPGGHRASADDVGLDEGPRRVADRRDRLARVEERLREGDGLRLRTQVVGVRDPARQDQAVVVVGRRRVDRLVDVERVGLVEVVVGLHGPAAR
jgi:hypothetical protein